MNKIVTMHQPNYLPWLGFFSKIKHSDCFVIVDNIEFNRRGYTHRNKIRVNVKEGWMWLTIPPVSKIPIGTFINEVKLPKNNQWQKKHWKIIELNYKKADYFYSYTDFFEKLYKEKFEYLWQINEKIIFHLLKCFDINTEVIKSSDLDLDPKFKKADLIIAILKNIDAKTYLSGPSGKNYLEFDKFKKNDIKLEVFEFKHPVYKQRYPGFEPNMAAIDLLFNMGEKSKGLI